MDRKKMYKILAVDDDETTRTLLSGILGEFEVVLAESGSKALELAKNEDKKPDLILLDLVMPRMKGDEVCKQLKADEKTRDIPVIFLTAKRDSEAEVNCLKLGAVDFITKPIYAEVLSTRVETQLELKLHRDHLEQLVRERTQEIEDTQKEIILTLSEMMENRSKETARHVERVSRYMYLLALKTGFKLEEAELLKMASPMHDIGKVGIPDKILDKPGKLTEDEFEIMKKHSEIGYRILEKSRRTILKTAKIIACQHHERWDGRGYPRRLNGEQINIYGRIAAIADSFDAMANKRCYKEAQKMPDIIKEFERQQGKQFDPYLTKLFLDNIKEFEDILITYAD